MHKLTKREQNELLHAAAEIVGCCPTTDAFADCIHGLLDDIAGFELASDLHRTSVIEHLWRSLMNAAATPKPAETSKAPTTKGPVNKDAYKTAIVSGKAMLKEGKTKAEVAHVIYGQLKGETREVVVQAFVDGASLTEKGAVTYWYNCRRKVAKKATKES